MATRKRIIYQSEAVYVGPTPSTGLHIHPSGLESGNYVNQLDRVQSVSYGFSTQRQDVNQLGMLAPIDRIITQAPTVNLDLTYLLTNGKNEQNLGFLINGVTSAISGMLNGTSDEKNYFVLTAAEGADAIGNTDRANHEVIAVGNGFMSNYSLEAAVGGLPTVSVSIEGLNVTFEENSSGNNIPAVNPENGLPITGVTYVLPLGTPGTGDQPTALRHGDISLVLATPFGAKLPGEFSEGTAHIQNISFQVPLSREPLERIGSKFAFSREITFPVTVTLNVTANLADLKTGNLADVLCNDQEYDLSATFREPSCTAELGDIAFIVTLKNAKLDSQNFSSSIGQNKSVDLSFSAQLSGPEDLENGLFMSGAYVA